MNSLRTLDPSVKKIFDSVLEKTKGQLSVHHKDDGLGLKLLRQFDELKNYESLYVHNVVELKSQSGSFIMLLAEKHLTVVEYKRTGTRQKAIEEVEPVLLFSVPRNMGRVFIRKETLTNKLADLFFKTDIDFKAYPRFSRNYFLVGENPALIREHLPKSLIETLEKVEGMTVEINGNWGLIRPEKNLTEDVLLLLLSVGYNITKS